MEMWADIPVIRAEHSEWKARIGTAVQSKLNFLVVHSGTAGSLGDFLGDSSWQPEKLERWGVYAMNQVLAPHETKTLLQELESGKGIYFVEQIKLPTTRPPNVKEFLTYCELRGVVGESESINEARTILSKYVSQNMWGRGLPFSGVYQWKHTGWEKLHIVF